MRINIHFSSSFVELHLLNIVLGLGIQEEPKDRCCGYITQPLPTFIFLYNSCLYQITDSLHPTSLYFFYVMFKIQLLHSVSLWFSMPWPFTSQILLMAILKLLLQLWIPWFFASRFKYAWGSSLPRSSFVFGHILSCQTAYGMGQKLIYTFSYMWPRRGSGGHMGCVGLTFRMDCGNDSNCDEHIL